MASAAWAADTYPDDKIRMIVPFAAGGPTDVIGRLVAQRLSEVLASRSMWPSARRRRQPRRRAAKCAAPDGYTIVAVSTGFIINPSMYTTMATIRSSTLAPIPLVAASPNVITVHPSACGEKPQELIDLIKANPAKRHDAALDRLDPALPPSS